MHNTILIIVDLSGYLYCGAASFIDPLSWVRMLSVIQRYGSSGFLSASQLYQMSSLKSLLVIVVNYGDCSLALIMHTCLLYSWYTFDVVFIVSTLVFKTSLTTAFYLWLMTYTHYQLTTVQNFSND